MSTPSNLTRRVLFSAGSATVLGAGALALAACSAHPSGGADIGDGPDGGTGDGVNPTLPKIAAGTAVIKLADIPVGGTKSAKIGEVAVVLAQPTAGNVVCFSAICPHQGCVVGAAPKQFACPCHGSTFKAETGAVVDGPAVSGLTAIKVTVTGDAVVTA